MPRALRMLVVGVLASPAAAAAYQLGSFSVTVTTAPLGVSVAHPLNAAVWWTLPGTAFVGATEILFASDQRNECFDIHDAPLHPTCADQTVSSVGQDNGEGALWINGTLCSGAVGYSARFSVVAAAELALSVELDPPPPSGAAHGWVASIVYGCAADERFFGLGQQYTHLDASGRAVPVFVREQGVGRGVQPWTALINSETPFCGGDWSTSYTHAPQYVSSANRSLFLASHDYAVFNFSASSAGAVAVSVNATALSARLLAGSSMLDLVGAYVTGFAGGGMRPLPPWLARGGIVLGLEGGQADVQPRIEGFLTAHPDAPVRAVWLQDWVGMWPLDAIDNQHLLWNWQWNEDAYPDWRGLVASLTARGIRVLGYANGMLENVTAHLPPGVPRFLDVALARGFLVTVGGDPLYAGGRGLVDLTNPAARSWYAQLLVDNLLADPARGGGGLSGFMADFGEELPLAGGLGLWNASYGGLTPAQLHNAWPLLWQSLCGEAAALAEAQGVLPNGTTADDIVFFTRSAAAQTPGLTRLVWLGDQLTSWDGFDGLASAVTGLISGGFSGLALSHSDIGGYTSWDGARVGLPGVRVERTPELFGRWAEFAAFTPVYRTHPGADNVHDWQFDSDAATAALFARMGAVHAAWAFYAQALQAGDVAQRGWPLVRALGLHFPSDAAALACQDAFLLGSELLVAPVLQPNTTGRSVYLPALPAGAWTHVWTGANWTVPTAGPGRWLAVAAPSGCPPVFYPAGSAVGARFVANLAAGGLLAGCGGGWPDEAQAS